MFNSNNQWILVGLTNYGVPCARANYSDVYARVAAYVDWINSNMNGETSEPSSPTSTISSSMQTTSLVTLSSTRLSHASVMFNILVSVFILCLVRPFY